MSRALGSEACQQASSWLASGAVIAPAAGNGRAGDASGVTSMHSEKT